MDFRRIIAAVAALCITAPTVSGIVTTNATSPINSDNIVTGDVNVDYVFNLSDIVLFQRWLRGDKDLFPAYGEPGPGADANKDGKNDVFDLVAMRKLLVQCIKNAPEPSYAPQAQNLCAGIEKSPGTSGIIMNEGYQNYKEFIDSQLDFTVGLLQKTYSENKGENNLISPYSIAQALGMTANGAAGSTLDEMENVIGGGMPIDSLNRYFRGQREMTVNESDEPKWSINTANSIWIRNNRNRIQVLPGFIQNCVDYYDSECYITPFDDTTLADVNNWVNCKTNEMIPTILNMIDPNDVMYLVNAVTFQAEWAEPYEKYMITDGKFTAADGTVQEAEMLSSSEDYISDDNTKGIIKDYTGLRYAFAALLPDDNTSMDSYIESLTAEKLRDLLSNRFGKNYSQATAVLPKFSYEYENELSEELANMGMPTAFSDEADFSNMSAIAYLNPLQIGYVIHKTFIELDENGTKAAAATLVAIQDKAMPIKPKKTIVFDRPFVYCIYDTETYVPLFIGVLNSLS
ncbi:MAG: hypothetical protein J6U00_11745 [Ruminococcus sp.]|uniref:serpin family protein n=1 Tax=Ruminococcus sp. TaxID=41978 RepID=UPI001B22EF4A|nr:serpin family protein [Ruminococcus sp.]MBO7474645.1 hypothetical protein [Ruminococcus sp.]